MAAVTEALLALPTWRRRLERLAERSLSAVDTQRYVVLAFLHDTGKAGAGFQAKALAPDEQATWRRVNHCGMDQQGHTRVVAPLLGFAPEYAPHREALGVDRIRHWGGDSILGQNLIVELWLATVSHHGEPIAFDDKLQASANAPHPTWISTSGTYRPLDGLRDLRLTMEAIWPQVFHQDAPSTRPSQAFIHAFAGLVSLADWIASDTRHFPFDLASGDRSRWQESQRAAKSALRKMRIDVEDIRADLRRRAPSFETVFEFKPTEVQRATAAMDAQSPVVLEAETGSGKTEAALWRFKTLFEAGEIDSLCFLLPTRVAATGIAARLETFVTRLFPSPDLRPNVVLAIPGYLRANALDGQWLAPHTAQWPDHEVGDPLFWAAENSKRYFAAAMAAATIDQFLLSTLQTKHAHLRGSVLLRALVVVDEVHASDPYMRALLVTALRRHQMAGGHALLLSATLTNDLRQELLATALTPRRRLGLPVQPAAPELPDDYPRLSAPDAIWTLGKDTRHKRTRHEPQPLHKRIHHELQPWMRDPEAVARCAAQALAEGARVLILRNTVRQAVATQQALGALLGVDHPALFRCRNVVAMHHGRYALPDRRALDARVGELFGKDAAKAQGPLVLCATQTVEISVDCDADFLITDLAPMDVLLQRLGRLHRHAARHGWRPTGYSEARCVVLTPPDPDLSGLLSGSRAGGLGLGPRSAYPNLLALQATWYALLDYQRYPVLDIPTHNRALVEQTCGGPALAQLAARLGRDWLEHLQTLRGQASAQGSAALYQCVRWDAPWREAAPGELSTEARTRLGLDSIDLLLPPGIVSPLGLPLERLAMPAWMLSRTLKDDDAVPTVDELQQDKRGLYFKTRGQAFQYTRWGLAGAEHGNHSTQ